MLDVSKGVIPICEQRTGCDRIKQVHTFKYLADDLTVDGIYEPGTRKCITIVVNAFQKLKNSVKRKYLYKTKDQGFPI